MARYAIYFAPSTESALWRFGCRIIGYDAASSIDLDWPELPGSSATEWASLTSEPRRYGFHATLKAPFRLKDGVEESDLLNRLAELSSHKAGFALGSLQVRAIGSFIAIVPRIQSDQITEFAADIVRYFEPIRAPLNEQEIARRLQSPLTENQKRLLLEFGYPYVMEEYRFHMTLTGPVHFEQRAKIESVLNQKYAEEVGEGSLLLNQIALFKQDTPRSRFRIIKHIPLVGSVHT